MEKESEGKESNLTKDIVVIFEDDEIMVINKPSGILVHGDGRSREVTVIDWFLTRVPEARGIGEPGRAQDGAPLERSGVVHRLDRDTSGVLVLAKTSGAFEHLKAQFHDRLAKKEYFAFVYGTMKERYGAINRPIGRNSRDFRLRSAEHGAKGVLRPATTEWECISQSQGYAYLRLIPKTGRTHQIRVHLKSIGHPILKDSLYAPDAFLVKEGLGFTRLALHAHTLTIDLPNGTSKVFVAPFPPDFLKAKEAIASA